MRDPYTVLGISRGASTEEVKSAYKKLVKQHHPDRGGDTKKFTEIQEAYEAITNPSKQQQYGGGSSSSYYGGGRSSGAHSSSGFSSFQFKFGEDIFDFENLFQSGRRSVGPDIEVEISITLNDAYRGTSHEIEYIVSKYCTTCSGKGHAKESDARTCEFCKGSGVLHVKELGMLAQCDRCNGVGKRIINTCTKCSGQGFVNDKQSVSVQIPAGIDDGTRLKLSNYGHAGKDGAGDLYVLVHVQQHTMFARKKHDLYCSCTISFDEAILGTTVNVPDILGNIIKLDIPAGTQPGMQVTKPGYGMPIVGSNRKGSLYIEIKVSIPKIISNAQKELISKFKSSK